MFAFRLCLELGILHPDHLMRSLTSRQLSEWMVFYGLDPFGEQRADLRAGIVASVVNNRWRGRHETPREPADFMPFREQPKQTPDEIKRTLRTILGGMTHGKSRADLD
jgi:hypothetical protein